MVRRPTFVARHPGSVDCAAIYEPSVADRLNFKMVSGIARSQTDGAIELWVSEVDERGKTLDMRFVSVLREDPSWRS